MQVLVPYNDQMWDSILMRNLRITSKLLQSYKRVGELRRWILIVSTICRTYVLEKLVWHYSVISIQRLQIPVLPSIVNAALRTTSVSAGNAYTFNASRSLHALALDGRAPKFLKRLNKRCYPIGTPNEAFAYYFIEACRTWPLSWSCFFLA